MEEPAAQEPEPEFAKNAGHEVVGVRGFAGEIYEAQRSESRKSKASPTSMFENISNVPFQLFIAAFETSKWVLGLRWYIIILIAVIVSFLYIQLNSAVETRKIRRKAKKEGLEPDRETVKKRVTFGSTTTESMTSLSSLSFDRFWTGIGTTVRKIYNWWVVPWIYVIFRGIGLR